MAVLNLNCQKVGMIFLPKRGSIIRMEQPPKDLSRIETKSDKIPEIKKSTWTIWQTSVLHKHSGPLTHCRADLVHKWQKKRCHRTHGPGMTWWCWYRVLLNHLSTYRKPTPYQHHISTILQLFLFTVNILYYLSYSVAVSYWLILCIYLFPSFIWAHCLTESFCTFGPSSTTAKVLKALEVAATQQFHSRPGWNERLHLRWS